MTGPGPHLRDSSSNTAQDLQPDALQHGSGGIQQQQLLPSTTAADPQQRSELWPQFQQDYYLNSAMLAIDTTFYAVHLVSTTLQRRIFGTPAQKATFQAAVGLCAGALVLCLFSKPLYRRFRPQIVLATHLMLTVLRAAVFYASTSLQAVLYRGPSLVVEEDHQVGPMLLGMVTVMAAPMRLFEVLGLQQTLKMHALVAVAFLAMHPAAALQGARLAYSNTGFYVVHEAHDLVAAVMEGLLEAISGIPAAQQHTCSSCAGLVVYNTLGLFGSVAVPLYLAHIIEQAAFRRWLQRHAPDSAPPVGTAPAPGFLTARSAGSFPSSSSLSQQSVLSSSSSVRFGASASSGASSSSSLRQRILSSSASMSSVSRNSTDISSGDAQAPAYAMLLPAGNEQQQWAGVWEVVNLVLDLPSAFMRWCAHVLVLAAMLVGSWAVSNAIVLGLLPKVLSRQQLERWCPNRPFTPYVIAGQIYEGL